MADLYSPVTDEVIAKLAAAISSDQMQRIALNYLDIKQPELKKIVQNERENIWAANFAILTRWRSETVDSKEKLANILYDAARDGLVSFTLVEDILGLPAEKKNGKRQFSTDTESDLTEKKVLRLSELFTERVELLTFATVGLQLDEDLVLALIEHPEYNISGAALKLILIWRKKQPNSKVAYVKICKALQAANMEFYIGTALK